ncbi:hypothetical protein [uncultured Tateyamaria sp.]|uniref:hypothetical protein n=1 Tax=uncultured Tateyamaria sp. TaxID=455651 RepID=UPI00262DA0EE|nr:hypothetical protein [uncultured Tateyamaria sp.]
MSILSIIGGGGGSAQPVQQSSNRTQPDDSAAQTNANESQDSTAAQSGNATQTQDTAAPAPATGAGDIPASAAAPPSNPETEAARVALQGEGSTAQSVVQAAVAETPDQIEADARRMAEAAQQQQRLELLIEAVNTPVEHTTLSAPTAQQEQAGPVETEGTPV